MKWKKFHWLNNNYFKLWKINAKTHFVNMYIYNHTQFQNGNTGFHGEAMA